MPSDSLEQTLKNLPRIGELIERDETRQVWRFMHGDAALRLHFYPRSGRTGGGNPALRELQSFQRLQKAGVPSPRAHAAMVGFRLGDELGDALVLESIEPSTRLDEAMREGNHLAIRRQLVEIGHLLARAGLGDDRLSLRSFLVRDKTLYLADARGVRRGGLRLKHLFHLAESASSLATKSDLLRCWRELGPDRPLPLHNPVAETIWRRFIRTIFRETEHFGLLSVGEWSGVFTRRAPRPVDWAIATRSEITAPDWLRAWPQLLEPVQQDQLQIIKRADNGDVLGGEVRLGDRSFAIVVKRPRRKYFRQHIAGLFLGSRARRTWIKTWKMLIRGVPCEWPMLLMERRVLGYAVESMIVFERVPGATLANIDLDAVAPAAREDLFRRAGRILRKIENLGFTHADAKSTNWIAFEDPQRGPSPILVDVDGVRHYRWSMLGIDRLLRAMKQHPQYTPQDSFHLCQGFAPRARLVQEPVPPSASDDV